MDFGLTATHIPETGHSPFFFFKNTLYPFYVKNLPLSVRLVGGCTFQAAYCSKPSPCFFDCCSLSLTHQTTKLVPESRDSQTNYKQMSNLQNPDKPLRLQKKLKTQSKRSCYKQRHTGHLCTRVYHTVTKD